MHKGRPCGRKAGMKFGNLILISSESRMGENGKYKRYWQCRCVCGNTVERRDDYLKAHPANNFSCGCLHSMKTNLGEKSVFWEGCGDISGMYFAGLRCKAKTKNMEFTITIQEIWNLFEKQHRLCALTGLPISFEQSQRLKKKNGSETTASLDRIDSNKGYTIDNVQWIHKDVNKMKNAFTQDRFLEICRLVTEQIKSRPR